MYTLKNDQLIVSILDPIADRERLGARYCTGGYIYQVNDAVKGELFAGPEYPAPFPNVFDGQGAPDMFFTPLMNGEVPVGGEVACIGVGRVKRTSDKEPFDVRFNPEVIEFLPWTVDHSATAISMSTAHTWGDWAYTLTRQVTLSGRTLHSKTSIASQGKAVLPIRWFAHPFFPLPADNVLCRFSQPIHFPQNPGYFLNDSGFICRKPDSDWTRGGWYQPLEYEMNNQSIIIVERHPKVGQVTVTTDFMPGFFPIWGNHTTFSFEPYFIRSLARSESAEWSIEYRF